MKKGTCLVLTLILLNTLALAQSDTTNVAPKPAINKPYHAIKWFPLYFLNRFPAVQMSYERHLVNNLNIELSGGYVLDLNEDNLDNDFIDKRGFKAGVQLRQYLFTRRVDTYYVSIGLDYHRINYDRSRTFGFDCFGGFGCSFLRFDEYEIERQDRRISTGAGFISDIGQNFYLELAIGLTVNWRKYRTLDKITGFDIEYGDDTLRENENQLLLRPSADITLIYRLK